MYDSKPQTFHIRHLFLILWDSIEMASKDSSNERSNLRSCKKLFKSFPPATVVCSPKMEQLWRR